MNDLLTSFDEAKEERIGIMQDSSVENALERAETDRHRAEINTLIRRHYPNDSNGLKAFLADVEKHRGKFAANRLRDDCREAWRMAMQQISEKSGAIDGKANGGKCE